MWRPKQRRGEWPMQTDRELIDAVRGGDHRAFAELVRRYERIASSTAWNVLWDYHSAQDATQNAFVEVFRQLNRLRSPEQSTRREALRLASRSGRARAIETAVKAKAFHATNPPADHSGELLAAIGSLPEQERVVVGLRYLEGYSVADIAKLTGRPVGTVTKQLSRAVERLKFKLRGVTQI
jgi:RNA polymerase sigma-70 factor (ECF subfamily)